MKLKITIFIIFFFIYSFKLSFASGILVSPEKLTINTNINSIKKQIITIANPTSDIQLFEIYPDEFSENIKLLPSSFTLEAGARKTVEATFFSNNKQKSGFVINTNISIITRPLTDNKLNVSAGIKIPTTVSFTLQNQQKNFKLHYLIFLVPIILTILFYFLRSKNKTSNLT